MAKNKAITIAKNKNNHFFCFSMSLKKLIKKPGNDAIMACKTQAPSNKIISPKITPIAKFCWQRRLSPCLNEEYLMKKANIF